MVLANYRSVSKLPFLGKVVERVMAEQLQAFWDDTAILDPFQSIFCPGCGTETVLVTLIDDYCRHLNQSGLV